MEGGVCACGRRGGIVIWKLCDWPRGSGAVAAGRALYCCLLSFGAQVRRARLHTLYCRRKGSPDEVQAVARTRRSVSLLRRLHERPISDAQCCHHRFRTRLDVSHLTTPTPSPPLCHRPAGRLLCLYRPLPRSRRSFYAPATLVLALACCLPSIRGRCVAKGDALGPLQTLRRRAPHSSHLDTTYASIGLCSWLCAEHECTSTHRQHSAREPSTLTHIVGEQHIPPPTSAQSSGPVE